MEEGGRSRAVVGLQKGVEMIVKMGCQELKVELWEGDVACRYGMQ